MAETKIDSSLAGALNCLTPVFVITMGALFFGTRVSLHKIIGILIALAGSFLLLFSRGTVANQHLVYILFIVLATVCYGFNVNMVANKLIGISSLHLAAIGLSLNALPAFLILVGTDFFRLPLDNADLLLAVGAATTLGIAGTAVATILFYWLIKRAGGVFASMVTYGIPFIAAGWGIIYKEMFGWKQVVCLLIILAGVYRVNKKAKIK